MTKFPINLFRLSLIISLQQTFILQTLFAALALYQPLNHDQGNDKKLVHNQYRDPVEGTEKTYGQYCQKSNIGSKTMRGVMQPKVKC